MTGWKIHHEWRCTSYWTWWNFPASHVSFQGCFWARFKWHCFKSSQIVNDQRPFYRGWDDLDAGHWEEPWCGYPRIQGMQMWSFWGIFFFRISIVHCLGWFHKKNTSKNSKNPASQWIFSDPLPANKFRRLRLFCRVPRSFPAPFFCRSNGLKVSQNKPQHRFKMVQVPESDLKKLPREILYIYIITHIL